MELTQPSLDEPKTPAPEPVADPPMEKLRKLNRRQRWIAAFAVVTLVSGLACLAGTWFYSTVDEPNRLSLVNNTDIFAADGTSQLAHLGSHNHVDVQVEKLSEPARRALVAGEDKHFWEHPGIDISGIARAAWNNVTGGDTQGGSTITQQYARLAANDMEISFARKLREAVMARKLEEDYTKDEILGFYLNSVYFGRGAHGIGAAMDAYFGLKPDQIGELTVAQAALLGAVLKQPEGDNGFDPGRNLGNAKGRWAYVLDNMADMGWLSASERAQEKYPDFIPLDQVKQGGTWGIADRATGYIVKYVEAELKQRGVLDELAAAGLPDWKNAGLRIVTSIDARAQHALEQQLDLSKQPDNLVGAGVAIDPGTGRVLAYYGGGSNGTETDWASSQEPHPPASSFKAYTLTAALQAGISTQSLWDASELHKGVNGAEADVSNAGREVDSLPCGTRCTLEYLTLQSYNVAFYKVAQRIGPQKVIEAARSAGVRTMWSVDPVKAYNLADGVPQGRKVFDYQVGFGQYPISVLDHATGMATLAAHGVHHDAHFVVRVDRKNRDSGKWERLADETKPGKQAIDPKVADEVTYVLKKIPGVQGHTLAGGRQAASKSGTWENGLTKKGNAHAWYVGYTEQIAAAIWIGSRDHNTTPIKDAQGRNIQGASLPGEIWEAFMNQAHKDMQLPVRKLTDGSGGKLGNPTLGEFPPSPSASPTPSVEPSERPTPPPTPTPRPTQPPTPTPSPTPKPTPTAEPTVQQRALN